MTRFWKTPEFWIGLIYLVLTSIVAFMRILTAEQWLLATAIVVNALILGRGLAKSATTTTEPLFQTSSFWLAFAYLVAATALTAVKFLSNLQWMEATGAVVTGLLLARGLDMSGGAKAPTA
jgi:hypothetical protein